MIMRGAKTTLEIKQEAHCYVFPTMAENCVLSLQARDAGSMPVNLFQPTFLAQKST